MKKYEGYLIFSINAKDTSYLLTKCLLLGCKLVGIDTEEIFIIVYCKKSRKRFVGKFLKKYYPFANVWTYAKRTKNRLIIKSEIENNTIF